MSSSVSRSEPAGERVGLGPGDVGLEARRFGLARATAPQSIGAHRTRTPTSAYSLTSSLRKSNGLGRPTPAWPNRLTSAGGSARRARPRPRRAREPSPAKRSNSGRPGAASASASVLRVEHARPGAATAATAASRSGTASTSSGPRARPVRLGQDGERGGAVGLRLGDLLADARAGRPRGRRRRPRARCPRRRGPRSTSRGARRGRGRRAPASRPGREQHGAEERLGRRLAEPVERHADAGVCLGRAGARRGRRGARSGRRRRADQSASTWRRGPAPWARSASCRRGARSGRRARRSGPSPGP